MEYVPQEYNKQQIKQQLNELFINGECTIEVTICRTEATDSSEATVVEACLWLPVYTDDDSFFISSNGYESLQQQETGFILLSFFFSETDANAELFRSFRRAESASELVGGSFLFYKVLSNGKESGHCYRFDYKSNRSRSLQWQSVDENEMPHNHENGS